jgi:hypothetical protein
MTMYPCACLFADVIEINCSNQQGCGTPPQVKPLPPEPLRKIFDAQGAFF